MKTRIDVECVCPVCALVFTIHGIDHYIEEVGSGYDIAKLECPNCNLTGLQFDLMRVEDENGFVEFHRKTVHDAKRKSKPDNI